MNILKIKTFIIKQLTVIFISLFLLSCENKITGKGEILLKDFPVEKFNQLSLDGNFKVFYKESKKSFVNIETYPNLIENLEIKSESGKLSISENNQVENTDFYNITIYGNQSINEIELIRLTNLSFDNVLMNNTLKLILKDKSQLMAKLLNQKTNIEMSGKSRLNLMGNTINAQLKISDSASFIAPHWVVNQLNIDAKNASYTELAIKSELNGTIENTAQLLYFENPNKNIVQKDKAKVQQK